MKFKSFLFVLMFTLTSGGVAAGRALASACIRERPDA